jgi:ribosomal-protein-alanine N-acetyltransferase
MNPTIRPMRPDDLDTVVELEQQIFVDAWSRSSFEVEIANNRYSFPLVMEWKGVIVGYAVIWHFLNELHIANFAIHPSYRRKGLGRQLMEHILQRFPDAEFAFLEVRRSNTAAIRLYESFGFRKINVRKGYYRDGEDALLMVKDLRK